MIYSKNSSYHMIDQHFKPFVLTGYEYRTEREKQFDLKRTVIDIKINFEEKAVEGKVELDLKLNSLPQDHLEIDAADMEIYNVSINGQPVKFESFPEKLFIYGDFKAFGNYLLTITYKAYPRRGGYFVEDPEGIQFWTQGEDTDSHAWFPCFDYPNTRSSYEIRVTVPLGYTVISNGSLVDKIDGDFSTFVFKEDFKFPSYLVSVIAGKFAETKYEWNEVPIHSFYAPRYADNAERSFKHTPEMMEFISGKTGVKYPYSRYSQTCVSDFVYGGMENLSATTLTDRTIHDEIAHLDYQSENLICHELTHQWFGDFVTCRDWSQAWLNEGFATYMALIYMEKLKGKDEFLIDVQNHKDVYLNEFNSDYARPIVERKYKDPAELFDRHLYQKAALFLRYLNYYLGDDTFWAGVKQYLETNRMKGVSTEDFRSALSSVSGFSLDSIFHQFVYEPGHPEFEISETTSKGKVTIKISQKGMIYNLRVPIKIYLEGNTEEQDITIDQEVTTLELEKKGFKAFSLDPESRLLKVTEYERPREETRFILENGGTVLERGDAAAELSKYGPSEIPFLMDVFSNEKSWYVKGRIASTISKIGGERSISSLVKLLDDPDYQARREVVKAVATVQSDKLLKKLKEMFSIEKGYHIRAAILTSAQKTGKEDSRELLMNGLKIESYDDVIRIAALNALGELGDVSTLKTIREFYSKKYRWQTRAASVRAISKLYWKDRTIGKFLLEALEDSYFAVRISAVEGILATGDFDVISKLSPYLSRETDGRVRRAMREALEYKGPQESIELKSLKEQVDKLKEKVSNLEAKSKTRK